jgi:two-component system cell cycle sensor histidine kinase/response regulator CckA
MEKEMNILVVDDEPAFRMLLKDYLQDQGWTVYTAANGEEGLKELEKTKIDFIISDVYMPVMDGIRFQKAVQAIPVLSQIPFLFVSGYDDDHTMEAVRSTKNVGFMKKSKPIDELKEWIHYLTTPHDRRPGMPPGTERKLNREDRLGRREDRYRK